MKLWNASIILLWIILIAPALFAATVVVDSTGAGNYLTIQEAVDVAMDADTIFVKNGTYSGFGLYNKKLTIIGESCEKTKIVDEKISFISSYKRIEIKRLRFTGTLSTGGLYINNFFLYRYTNIVPELIIENCVFDYDPPYNVEEPAIVLEMNYEDYLYGNVLDEVAQNLKIVNNTFLGLKNAMDIIDGGIPGKRAKCWEDTLPNLVLNANNNYYGFNDSLAIGNLVEDSRDDPGLGQINQVFFDYANWSDTVLTAKLTKPEASIRNNNFINCENVFRSYLYFGYDAIEGSESDIRPNRHLLLSAYPNPFNAIVTVTLSVPLPGQVIITVFDIEGRIVHDLTKRIYVDREETQITVDFFNQASGMYFISAHQAGQAVQKKVLLIK